MDDWLKSGWFVLANRDIEVIRYDEQSVTREEKLREKEDWRKSSVSISP